jgi:hypothetical protein
MRSLPHQGAKHDFIVMVTLPTVSSFSSGGAVAVPRRRPPLVVASMDSMNLSHEWSLSRPTSLPCWWCTRCLVAAAHGRWCHSFAAARRTWRWTSLGATLRRWWRASLGATRVWGHPSIAACLRMMVSLHGVWWLPVNDGLCSTRMAEIDCRRPMMIREDDGAWRRQVTDKWQCFRVPNP